MHAQIQEKLIRDKIGVKIMGSRESGSIRITRDIQERVQFLVQKTIEECKEFGEAHSIYQQDRSDSNKKSAVHYEAADILEVLDTLISLENGDSVHTKTRSDFVRILETEFMDYSMADILTAQREKRERLGGFDGGYILKI